jgi:GDP-L-fucose synthase
MSEVVLVTGASGMLGGAVVRRLRAEPNPPYVPSTPERGELDLLDPAAVHAWFRECRPRAVLHLAGHVRGLAENMGHQVAGLAVNGRITLNVLQACAEFAPERMVIAASNAAYGFPYTRLPLTEDDLFVGDVHPGEYGYAWGNRTLVAAAETLRLDRRADVRIALLTNMFGPGDRFDEGAAHVIPALIARFSHAVDSGGEEVTVWGKPDTTRDFIYVDDAAHAMLCLLEADDPPMLVNVASGIERRMANVVASIAAATGFTGAVLWDSNRPVGIPRRSVDISRLRTVLADRTEVGFSEGIRRTVAWYRDHHGAAA